MKILIPSLLFLTSISFFVFAQGLPIGSLPPDINCGSDFFECLAFFFYELFLKIIIALAYILATIFISLGGIEYIIYGAKEERRKIATQRLIWGSIGLIIAISAHALVILIEKTAREGAVEQDIRQPTSNQPTNREGTIYIPIPFPPGFVPISPPPRGENNTNRDGANILYESSKDPVSYNDILNSINLLKMASFYLPLIAYADIREPKIPEKIKCGPVDLPSVLSPASPFVWKLCVFYYLQRFTSFLYALALSLGVLFLVWAGILYITKPEKTQDVHSRLFYGILGIVIAILSFTIVKIINLFFVNLS